MCAKALEIWLLQRRLSQQFCAIDMHFTVNIVANLGFTECRSDVKNILDIFGGLLDNSRIVDIATNPLYVHSSESADVGGWAGNGFYFEFIFNQFSQQHRTGKAGAAGNQHRCPSGIFSICHEKRPVSLRRSLKSLQKGLEKDFKIQPQRPIINIFQIHFHPALKSDFIATAYLPNAGNTGLERQLRRCQS